MPRIADQRDKNEAEYVELWRKAGCLWIKLHPGDGCDGILVSPQTGIHIVEVKNPEGFGTSLTTTELKMKLEVESRGATYNVVTTLEEAQKLIEGS